jgi:hypothetical protein
MQRVRHERYGGLACRTVYPGSRQTCDVVLTGEWMVEVKMAPFYGDNGKRDDTAIKDLISPFEVDRSALGGCEKLVKAGGAHTPARSEILPRSPPSYRTLHRWSAQLG